MRRLLWIVALLLPLVSHAQEPAGIPVSPDPDLDSLAVCAGREVSAIDLAGIRVTREYIVRREIRTQSGAGLDLELLDQDVSRLENLSIFAEVLVSAEADSGDRVRLVFRFREMPAVIPVIAFLYTEENGFSVGPGISSLNLRGKAVSLSGRAYVGGADQYWVRGIWPWITGNHFSVDVYTAGLMRPDVRNDFNENSTELTVKLGTYLGDNGRLLGRGSRLIMKSDVPGITLSPDDQDELRSLWATVGWDSRDSFRQPRRGWQYELEMGKTGGPLGGKGNFETLILDVRRWLPVGRSQKTLLSGLLSLQSGTVGTDFPGYLRYHIGGANSVRGYPVQGPDETQAGKSQLIGTVEHSFGLFPVRRFDVFKWSFGIGLDAAVFGDAGVAWDEPADCSLQRTRTGLGGGLRLLVPGAEMMRLELAWNGTNDVQFHFAVGSKPVAQRARVR
jgi:outer membrane protein insertion porin family